MKPLSFLLLLTASMLSAAHAQKFGKDEVNFSDPFQIDSSSWYIIPKLIDNDNAQIYGKGKGYLPWGSYADLYFYNAATNQTKRLFNGQIALIESFIQRRYYRDNNNEKEIPANILPRHIIYLIRTENFNNDNGLDSDDPLYLYVSTKTGDHLKQITPKGFMS